MCVLSVLHRTKRASCVQRWERIQAAVRDSGRNMTWLNAGGARFCFPPASWISRRRKSRLRGKQPRCLVMPTLYCEYWHKRTERVRQRKKGWWRMEGETDRLREEARDKRVGRKWERTGGAQRVLHKQGRQMRLLGRERGAWLIELSIVQTQYTYPMPNSCIVSWSRKRLNFNQIKYKLCLPL